MFAFMPEDFFGIKLKASKKLKKKIEMFFLTLSPLYYAVNHYFELTYVSFLSKRTGIISTFIKKCIK